jgi:hypothetical protein
MPELPEVETTKLGCVIIHHLNRATHTQMNNQCAYLKLNQQILASALYFIDENTK